MQKRVSLFVWLSALFISAPVFAQTPDFSALLKKVDALATFNTSDFSADCHVIKTVPGEGQTVNRVALFRRDAESKYLILILEPLIDRGKGYLKIGQGLWLYQPKNRTFEYTSSKERFQNSNARNSDFTHSNFSEDYIVTAHGRETLGTRPCWVLSLKAVSNDVTFPYTKIWVSDDNLVRKTEDYSLSGQLLRTTAMPSYQKVGTRYVPVKISIVDALRGRTIDGTFNSELTEISIDKPSLAPLPGELFTKPFLEKFSK